MAVIVRVQMIVIVDVRMEVAVFGRAVPVRVDVEGARAPAREQANRKADDQHPYEELGKLLICSGR